MRLASFEAIAGALDASSVRYLVAGGLTVGAHGYLRFTKDTYIVIQLISDNTETNFLGPCFSRIPSYRPIVPITMKQFSNSELRQTWVRDKRMQVLQVWSDAHRETSVDVSVSEPFAFDDEYAHTLVKPLHDNLAIRFVSLATLIRMKEDAGRPQDKAVVEQLRTVRGSDVKKTNESPTDDIDWSLTTWKGARREQTRRWARMPLAEMILASRKCRCSQSDSPSRTQQAHPPQKT